MLNFLKNIKSETAVGLLIVAGAGLLVYSSIQVTGWKSDETEVYEAHVLLDNVTGLSVGTAVRMAGIKIGEVSAIELENGRARVYMKIYKKYRLRRNSSVAIKSLGILGDKYVEISAGSPGYEKLEENGEILLVKRNSDLDSMVDSLSQILDDFQQVTSALRESMGGEQGAEKFNSILANLNGTLERLNAIAAENQQGVKSIVGNLNRFSADLREITARNKSDLEAIVSNIEAISAGLRSDLPGITSNLRGLLAENRERLDNIILNLESSTAALNNDLPEITRSLRHSFSTLEETSGKLDNSVANVESITGKIDDGEGSLGRLVNDGETVDKLNKALDDLGGFLGDAQKLKFDLDFKTEYLSGPEKFKSYLGLELFPYRDHSFIVQLVDDPNGKSETKTEETATTNADGSVSSRTEKTTTYTDSYKFSLMITQRYFDTRFRMGLIENAFGFGVDQYFGVNDDWRTYAEAYDFSNEEDNAHYKLGATWRFLGNFYLTAGADHFAAREKDNRSYFFGIGLGFNEDSLRTLATAAGSAATLGGGQ